MDIGPLEELNWDSCTRYKHIDITVNVMNHNETHFITGCNVIKYLNLYSKPVGKNFTITLDMTSDGNILLENDRKDKRNNYMTHFYNLEDLIKVP